MRFGAIFIATIGLSGVVAGAWVRAQSGGPPTIGPVVKPTVTVPTEAALPVIEELAPKADSELTVSTSSCEIVLAQAAEEIEWWRTQVPIPPPSTTSPASPPGPLDEPPVAGEPPVIGPLAPPKLPTADALKTAADPSATALVPAAVLPDPEPPFTGSVLDRPRIKQVAALVKDMKPKDAALVVADLDESLAVGLLAKMPPRSASAIASALSPELAARLLTRLSQLPNLIVEEP